VAKIPVGILGATGTVGQRFVQLLDGHPWFQVTALAASDRSAGRPYRENCHWQLPTPIPEATAELVVQPIVPNLECHLVFSALPSAVAGPAEEALARAGYAVCSNAASHRMDEDVPLLIPEVNPGHTTLIERQRRRLGGDGFIVTSANCSTTQLALVLKPLQEALGLHRVAVVTLQAISGAGYPGVPSLDILGNVVPHICGEEEKVEREPRKLLGTLAERGITEAPFSISAQCNRVPVRDGHTECVSVEFAEQPSPAEVAEVLATFRAPAEIATLPSSPERPIHVLEAEDRPQPIRDRGAEGGMSVCVGRIRPCPVLGTKFVLLGHNTVRGAAGGAIHNAELLVAQGWVNS
jgi:aspartate-semialdehyde dehydrogenase